MNKMILLLIAICFPIMVITSFSYALDRETHRTINSNIIQKTMNGFSLNSYLTSTLGFDLGVNEPFVNSSGVVKKAWEWVQEGGKDEDEPLYLRSGNHFHNPIRSIDKAGFTGVWDIGLLFSGESAILWSQMPASTQTPGGHYSWYDVRSYYLNALTAPYVNSRNASFADTFRGLGQLMHLVQDMSVPEHARNDGHYLPAYEDWVLNSGQSLLSLATTSPIFFDKALLSYKSPYPQASVPIAMLFSTAAYSGNNPNPNITQTIPKNADGSGGLQTIGLSEYTNANFLSPDTMFTDNLPPTNPNYFPYPLRAHAILTTDATNKRQYLMKTGDGDMVNHLAYCGLVCSFISNYYPNNTLWLSLDDACMAEYATKLLPRAVGYSANLLNYFFRGSIDIVPNNDGFVIVNHSDEEIQGTFSLYYDDSNDTRTLIKDDSGHNATWDLQIAPNGQSSTVSFSYPTGVTPPKKYTCIPGANGARAGHGIS